MKTNFSLNEFSQSNARCFVNRTLKLRPNALSEFVKAFMFLPQNPVVKKSVVLPDT